MRLKFATALLLLSATVALAVPAGAQDRYWQCAAFAREFSGLQIYGDAWTWWDKAEGAYSRGSRPRVGAVMAFEPSARMRLGHVATVTSIEDARTITITHANWSPINGTRGQIERDVRVEDVSEDNDWSRVRVWFAPLGDLGTTAWPVRGFIYPDRVQAPETKVIFARAYLPRAVPKLAYARIDTLRVGTAPARLDLGSDLTRLALLEVRSPNPGR